MAKELPPTEQVKIDRRYQARLAALVAGELSTRDVVIEDPLLDIENTPIYKELEAYPGD
jgi:hypothetical protein